jgi:hypothetical protein
MTDKKISDLSAAGTLDGTESIELVQSGTNKKATAQAVANLAITAFGVLTKTIRYAQTAGSGGPDFSTSSAWTDGTASALPLTTAGSGSAPASTPATSLATSIPRYKFASSANTNTHAGAFSSRNHGAYRSISSSVLGGGFDFFARFSFETLRSDQRLFVGLGGYYGSSLPSASSDPSALLNIVGIGKDEGDTNLKLMHNDGSGVATEVDLGFAATTIADKLLELTLHCDQNGSAITYDLYNVNTATHYTGTLSTNLPAQDVLLNALLYANTGGTTTTSVSISITRVVLITLG